MNSNANLSCRICHAANSHGQIHHAQEMMFGLREPFDYLECAVCGCLQLLNPPADLSRHYPLNYYSFRRHGRSMRWLRGRWARHAFTGRDRIGALVTRWHGEHQAVTAMARMNAPRTSRILDIGCGHGHFLEDLAFLGFTHLTGVDPFLKTPRPEGPIRLLRAQVHELSETFDIVTLHHAYEHVPEPTFLLNSIRQRLAPGGTVVIRIPWAESRLWREFGVAWFQLDAPRHFSLFTRRSLERVAAEAGMQVRSIHYEATGLPLFASQQYQVGIAGNDPGFLKGFRKVRVTLEQAAIRDNQNAQGDSICASLCPL